MFDRIYRILHDRYGPQNWWPTTLPGEARPSYHGRNLPIQNRYEIVLGAVLTQNTAWANVEKAIFNLNKTSAVCPEKILCMPDSELSDAIRPSGCYNIKARRLKSVTGWWKGSINTINKCERNSESLSVWRESLLGVYGIGEETADSILLYAFDFPSFVIDAYTKRIMSRHYGISHDISYGELRELFMKNIPENVSLYKEYHALLVSLAKDYCLKSSCRPGCPLCADCGTREQGRMRTNTD